MSARARLLTGIAVAVLVIAAAAGYWWVSRPPAPYKPDNSGLYPINVSGKYGFMDRSGKTVITPQFDGAYGFSEGLSAVRIGTKWGYINTKGTVVITPQFDSALPFRYGRATVMQGSLYGFIDKDGKYICTPDYSWVGDYFSQGLALVAAPGGHGGEVFVDRSGKVVLSVGLNIGTLFNAKFNDGLAPAMGDSHGKCGYVNLSGKWVIEPQFEFAGNFADGLARVAVGGRWGYINQKGKFVVNPQYDGGSEFHDGYAVVVIGGKYGFIDMKGRVVADATFLGAGNFSDGLAPVRTEDGWGFIDRTGKMVVSPQFDTADSFQNGLAHVTALGKEAYITKTGAFVIDPFPGTTVRSEKERVATAARAEAARIAAEAAKAAQASVQTSAANRSRVAENLGDIPSLNSIAPSNPEEQRLAVAPEFPISGEGYATKDKPLSAWIDPSRTYTRFDKSVKLVYVDRPFITFDGLEGGVAQNQDKWRSLPAGRYLVYPLKADKASFRWWQ